VVSLFDETISEQVLQHSMPALMHPYCWGGLTVKTKSMKIKYFHLCELTQKGWNYITGNIKNYRLSKSSSYAIVFIELAKAAVTYHSW
jgi:hypothetical protein